MNDLTDQEKDILNVIVDSWDKYDGSMLGRVSYQEVFELLDRLGLKRPEKISALITKLDGPR